MTDILIHPLPFGGMAMEPVSPEGVMFLEEMTEEAQDEIFIPGDACMEGFSENAVGLHPQMIDYWLEEAQTRGLAIRRGGTDDA